MKTNRPLWLLTAPLLLVPFSSGCFLLKAPDPEPEPTPVPEPKPPYFDPAAGITRGKQLNVPGDAKLPESFRFAGAISGEVISIQSMKRLTPTPVPGAAAGDPDSTGTASVPGATAPGAVTPGGVPAADPESAMGNSASSSSAVPAAPVDAPLLPGGLETVRLAGVVAPSTEPGLQGARLAILNWTNGQQLDVDQDLKYPTDLSGKKVVQVFFKGRKLPNGKPGPYEGQTMSLNRMLVRSGWAVVDLYSPTSFDTSQWLYDEAHARRMKLGFWKYGQAIQQRIPVPTKGTGALSTVRIIPTDRPGTGTPGSGTGTAPGTLPTTPLAPPTAPTTSAAQIPPVSNSASG